MTYDSKRITAELIARRDEYRRKRRRRLAAGSAIGAAVFAAALTIGLFTRQGKLSKSVASETPAPPRVTALPRGDRMFGPGGPSEGWYNAPIEGKAAEPASVCVYTMSCGMKTLCNINDPEAIGRIMDYIALLEKDGPAPAGGGETGFSIVFTHGRWVFRLEELEDGRFVVNDRGCFKLPEGDSEGFTDFVEACAETARESAGSVMLSFGGEPIVAFTTFTDQG